MDSRIQKFIERLISLIESSGSKVTEEQRALLEDKLQKKFEYIPRIGVFGQTGVGKSSFVNAMFGEKICPVSNVEACTRDLQEVKTGNIVLVDFPGIGEDPERDKEYQKLYNEQIPKLDAILWVLDSSTRTYANDINFYNNIKNNFKTENGKQVPLFFIANKVDKIETDSETEDGEEERWDKKNNKPGTIREKLIQRRIADIAKSDRFDVAPNKVIPISAKYGYNLVNLAVNLLSELPKDKAAIVYMAQSKKSDSDFVETPKQQPTYEPTTQPTYPRPTTPTTTTQPGGGNPWTTDPVTTAGNDSIWDVVLDIAEELPVVGGAVKTGRKIWKSIKSLF